MISLPVYIYALTEPGQPWNIRYVGKTTTSLKRRLQQHLSDGRTTRRTHKNNWIRTLLSRGQRPQITLVDVADVDTWANLERFYIASYKEAGFSLVNNSDGGDQPPLRKGIKHTGETKLKMSKSHSKYCRTEEWRKAASLRSKANGNRPPSNKGKKHSKETIDKIKSTNKAYWTTVGHSLESRAKMSASCKAAWVRRKGLASV